MDRWTGKVALVTGASVGIGMQIATVLAKNGMKVIVAARRLNKLQELMVNIKQEYNVDLYPIRCDLREEKDILKMFKWVIMKLGGVDVLINNAGIISKDLISGKLSLFFSSFPLPTFFYTLSLENILENLPSHKRNFTKYLNALCYIISYVIDLCDILCVCRYKY